jgi:glycosyltransferase involved in cell wall biosynthesis
MTVVLNGVDLSRFEVSENRCRENDVQHSFVVGMAGRLTPEKGQSNLIRAVMRLRQHGLDIRLKLAGEGSWRSNYERLAREQATAEAVEFLGEVRDMTRFYNSLDVFVLSSLEREGLPRVLLEAMACGLPCIATDCEGVGDVVTEGKNCLIVPRGDVTALCKALTLLHSDEALRRRLSTNGQALVKTGFGIDRVTNQILDIYDAMLGLETSYLLESRARPLSLDLL